MLFVLQISKPMSEYIFTYQVRDSKSVPVAHLTETVNYELGELYTISIILTHVDVTVSFNGKIETCNLTGSFVPFVEYPATTVILGGNDDSLTSFTGCIAQLSVNNIEFPLNGLLKNNDSSIQVRSSGGSGGFSTVCDLCQMRPQPCPGNSTCVSNSDGYNCTCPKEHKLNEDSNDCEPLPTDPPKKAGISDSPNQIPLYYFIAGGVAVVILIAIGLLLIVCIIKIKHYKQQAKKQTYCVGGEQQLPNLGTSQRSKPNSYTTVTRQQSDRSSSEPAFVTASQLTHDSCTSMATFKEEHDIDEDIESGSNIQTITRSKLSTSGETGFHTASERDERSIPRMEDSGNEKDTDYSPCDSESDDMEYQSSYMEAVTSRGIRVSDTGQARGLPSFSSSDPISSFGAPLSWKEKSAMVPLRPDSQSELDEETDLDTDFSSTHLPKLSRVYQTPLKPPSSITPETGVSGHQWYKSSTFSDNERERARAEDYYPAYRESPQARVSAYENSHLPPLRSISSPANPRIQSSRPKRGHQHYSPPISSLTTSYNHNTLPSSLARSHAKPRENNISENSKVSASILSQSQPLKYHHPFFRQSSSGSTRIHPHLAAHSYMPSFIRSYSDESSMKGGEKRFVDLGSVRTNCDPIQYWEGQRRMMPTVDQVDSYQVLSESFTPFNDSAADLSENKSQQSIPDHSTFLNQGGGEGTAEAIDINLLRLRDCDEDSAVTGTTLKGSETGSRVIHFPSADCSDEYRRASSINSAMGSNHPIIIEHSCSVPPSQGAFEV